MRTTFINTLESIAEQDSRILLLTGDLGFMVMESFMQRFPDRFFNVGVAEQNMVGLATGLAESGFIPFVYSIATFASLRPFEFIRNGPILHQLPVRIVGVGGGFDYGHAGVTHFALEDIGVMRTQPGITVISPADYQQTSSALLSTWDLPGPIYYRLGKDDNKIVPGLDGRFKLSRAQVIREGEDMLIVTMGSISNESFAAADILATQGIEATVLVVACLNPPPINDLSEIIPKFRLVLTAENHYLNGGVGSLVSEVVAGYGLGCRVVRCGIQSMPDGFTGSQEYMNNAFSLNRTQLSETALRHFKEMV